MDVEPTCVFAQSLVLAYWLGLVALLTVTWVPYQPSTSGKHAPPLQHFQFMRCAGNKRPDLADSTLFFRMPRPPFVTHLKRTVGLHSVCLPVAETCIAFWCSESAIYYTGRLSPVTSRRCNHPNAPQGSGPLFDSKAPIRKLRIRYSTRSPSTRRYRRNL